VLFPAMPCCAMLCCADEPDGEPGMLQKLLLGPGSHLALAVLCSKAMIPIKLPIAVAITPYVYRWGLVTSVVRWGRG
jgi:hypothetical protein